MLHRTRTVAVSILLSLFVMSCGGGGDGGGTQQPTPTADPKGYYDNRGTASVLAGPGNTQVPVTDLQGIIHNNRLMMLSVAQDLSYDGSITVSGSSFSGTLSVYFEGALQGMAPVTGTINQGASISGTLTGSGAGSGSFQLLYAANNVDVAALSRVEDMTTPFWEGPIGGSSTSYRLAINSAGSLSHAIAAFDGTFEQCEITGTVNPIAGSNLYTVAIMFDGNFCINSDIIANNNYTGLATTRQRNAADDTLVMIATNGSYSVATDFVR